MSACVPPTPQQIEAAKPLFATFFRASRLTIVSYAGLGVYMLLANPASPRVIAVWFAVTAVSMRLSVLILTLRAERLGAPVESRSAWRRFAVSFALIAAMAFMMWQA